MFWILAALVAAFSCLDGWMTQKIINRYGIAVELNWLIRKFAKVNLTLAIILGMVIPRTVIIGLAWALNAPAILAALVVLQTLYAQKQLRVHWDLAKGEK